MCSKKAFDGSLKGFYFIRVRVGLIIGIRVFTGGGEGRLGVSKLRFKRLDGLALHCLLFLVFQDASFSEGKVSVRLGEVILGGVLIFLKKTKTIKSLFEFSAKAHVFGDESLDSF